jgi:hypothetical protein
MFGNATEVTDAARLIQLQKQTGSVRDYAAKFQELAVVLDWNDAALMEMYRKGLRDDVKDELIRYRTPVDNLGQMIEATSIIGDQLYERHLERKYDGKTTRAPAYRNTPNIGRFRARPRDPDAMEIDNLQKQSRIDSKKMTYYACSKTGHISKDCRSKNKVYRGTINNTQKDVTCYACGRQGHYLKECPNKERRQLNSTEATAAKDATTEPAHYDSLSWTACYDDSCVIHFIVKSGAGWFPKKPKNKRKVSIYNHPKVPKREGPPKQY